MRDSIDVRPHQSLNFRRGYGLIVILAVFATHRATAQSVQRGEMEDILKIVSSDVQNNFYDSHLKGLDWPALTEETRQRIDSSSNTGQMILAISSLLAKLDDSHTYFVPPRLTQQADFGFEARPYGDDIRVYEVRSKGPAAKGGLSVGDKILSLNGVTVTRDNIRQILRLLERVVPAPSLDVEVLSPAGKTQTVHISARMILTQEHQYIESVWRVGDQQRARDVRVNFTYRDYGDGINYVAIPSFRGDPDATCAAIKKAEHSRALTLDLRGNGGGSEDALLAFLGFFNGHPQLLAKRIQRSQSDDLMVKPRYSGFDGSIVILVDSYSASAAELAARYLQLNFKAQVLGDKTSGMVNEGHFIAGKIGAGFIMPFGVVITDAKLVMPDGGELEGHGVVPDTQCIPSAEDLRQQRDPCLEQAIALAKKSLLDKPRAN